MKNPNNAEKSVSMGLCKEMIPYLKKFGQALMMAFPIVMVLVFVIYMIIPKESWISLYATPLNFGLYEATDIVYWEKTDDLRFLNNATISLTEDCLIYLYEEDGTLLNNPNEYSYIELYNESAMSKVVDERTESYLMLFDKHISFQNEPIIYENCYPAGNILLENGSIMYQDSGNSEPEYIRTNTFAILRDNDAPVPMEEYFFASIGIDEPCTVSISGDYALYNVNGECVISSEDCPEFLIEIVSDTTLVAIFEGVVSMIECEKDEINVMAYEKRFAEISDGKEDALLYTYLDSQIEYIIGSIQVSAETSSDSCFSTSYTLENGISDLHIAGNAKEVTIANKSLSYSPQQFIAENAGALIISIFTAIIGTFITLAKDIVQEEK